MARERCYAQPLWLDGRGRHIDDLKDWALKVQGRTNHNKAVCALANKVARICYAVLRDHEPYGKLSAREEYKKTNRTAYAVAAKGSKSTLAFAKRLITHHGSNDCIITG